MYKILVFSSTIFFSLNADNEIGIGKYLLKNLNDTKSPKTYIFSYPRSGNTWVRYCLEVLTRRPTIHYFNLKNISNFPLTFIADHKLNFIKSPIFKVHTKQELDFPNNKHNKQKDKLIFILRNPKEAMLRHLDKNGLISLLVDFIDTSLNKQGYENPYLYFENLNFFDSWPEKNKILICYEALMKNPKATLSRLLSFLNEDLSGLDNFISQLSKHKKIALDIYKYNAESITQGEDNLFHSRKLTEQERDVIDIWIARTYPYLWSKYLKNRYSEEALRTSNLY